MNSAGHPFGPGPVATISENSPRADAWRTIFGGLTAPIRTAVPQRVLGLSGFPILAYQLDLVRLSDDMMQRLVEYVRSADEPVTSVELVRSRLLQEGMPIKAEEVSTVTNEHLEAIIAGLEVEIAKATTAGGYHRIKLESGEVPSREDMLRDVRVVRDAGLRAVREDFAKDTRYQRETAEYDHKFDADNNIVTARVPNLRTVPSKPFRIAIVKADILHEISDDRPSDDAAMTMYVPKDEPSEHSRAIAEVQHHAALDAMLDDVTTRMDAQAGVPRLSPGDRIVYGVVLEPSATIGECNVTSPEDVRAEANRFVALSADDRVSSALNDAANGFRALSESLVDDPPVLCTCFANGVEATPFGPHCLHALKWSVRADDGSVRPRKHGGAHTCPRRCIECAEGAHHFCEVDMQPVFDLSPEADGEYDEDDQEERELLRKHPAHLAGCEAWYECRHCDAWIEASDNDDMDDEEDDANCCDECGETIAFCDCDPDSDDAPDSDDWDDDEDDLDDGDESNNEPETLTTRPRTQDVSSMIPSNDAQRSLLDVGPSGRPAAVQAWASDLARDILFSARFLGLVGVRVPNNVRFQWAPVIAAWPAAVQAVVHTWLNTPQEAAKTAKENVPTAVRALIDQANAGGES